MNIIWQKKKKLRQFKLNMLRNTMSKHFFVLKRFHIKKNHIKIEKKEGGMTPRPPINAIYCSLNLLTIFVENRIFFIDLKKTASNHS